MRFLIYLVLLYLLLLLLTDCKAQCYCKKYTVTSINSQLTFGKMYYDTLESFPLIKGEEFSFKCAEDSIHVVMLILTRTVNKEDWSIKMYFSRYLNTVYHLMVTRRGDEKFLVFTPINFSSTKQQPIINKPVYVFYQDRWK